MKKKNIIFVVIVIVLAVFTFGYFLINGGEKKSVYLSIFCDGKDLSKIYEVGDTFECSLLGENFNIKIKSMRDDKINLVSSDYGLFPERENGTISLVDNVKEFELYRGKELTLSLQATDVSSSIIINWE